MATSNIALFKIDMPFTVAHSDAVEVIAFSSSACFAGS